MYTDPAELKAKREEQREADRARAQALKDKRDEKDKKQKQNERVTLEWQQSATAKNNAQCQLATQQITSMLHCLYSWERDYVSAQIP